MTLTHIFKVYLKYVHKMSIIKTTKKRLIYI